MQLIAKGWGAQKARQRCLSYAGSGAFYRLA